MCAAARRYPWGPPPAVSRLSLLLFLWACVAGAAPVAAQPSAPPLGTFPEPPPAPAPDWQRPLVGIGALTQDHDGNGIPDRMGEVALVSGRVTAGTGLLRAAPAEIYVQDGTGGLRLLLPPSADPVLTGDSVLVHGVLWFRFGMAEMVAPAVRVLRAEPRQPEPRRLPILPRRNGSRGPDLEAYEAELVDIEGRVVQADSNQSGRQLVLLSGTDLVSAFAYHLRASPVRFENVRIGDYVRVRGIATQHDLAPPYNGSYVVLPLSEDDVRRAGLSPTEYKYGALAIGALLLFALLWATVLRRQVRKRSEALRTSEARYSHLFDAAADPVFVLDLRRGGEIIEANQAAQRALGVRPDGARADGRPVRLADLARDDHEAQAHLAQVDRTGRASGTLELLAPSGRAVPYEVATRQLRDDGGSVFVSVARDVEQRRRYEHGLLEAIEAAEAARERAEEADRLKSSILDNMSHEVRTPLTAILGFADILCDEVDEDLFDFADTIRRGGQRLLDTLNDILDFARLDAERATLLPESLNVTEVVRDAVARLAPIAQQKELGLRLQADAATVLGVHSRTGLERIVTTLVGNAIKFTDQGEVRVSVHDGDGFFAVRVRDTGLGISDDFLPQLYEAFKQESDGHGRSHEGNGLGLAVAKRLVDLMGGEIRVWSQKGEGTLFEVAFPTEAPPLPGPDQPSPAPAISRPTAPEPPAARPAPAAPDLHHAPLAQLASGAGA